MHHREEQAGQRQGSPGAVARPERGEHPAPEAELLAHRRHRRRREPHPEPLARRQLQDLAREVEALHPAGGERQRGERHERAGGEEGGDPDRERQRDGGRRRAPGEQERRAGAVAAAERRQHRREDQQRELAHDEPERGARRLREAAQDRVEREHQRHEEERGVARRGGRAGRRGGRRERFERRDRGVGLGGEGVQGWDDRPAAARVPLPRRAPPEAGRPARPGARLG
ncbi:hypothetical protein AMYX_40400 [Anaeromyxobacter diazotrophicus]|uniref:Uncharacterized protein n=1 Tax=Anaeromyxobacter diazotrophicus TaxID=2590199 RepID=A0A7I9VT71_9BACT|nr:hypothetical protein AMYX_40400 [Anaeromyxobacter diazotrophicus]